MTFRTHPGDGPVGQSPHLVGLQITVGIIKSGGAAPSRTKHAVTMGDGRIRRLVPDELDRLQMFPRGWTGTGMGDGHRAFCMGNALVTGIPHAIGKIIASDYDHAR